MQDFVVFIGSTISVLSEKINDYNWPEGAEVEMIQPITKIEDKAFIAVFKMAKK